MGPAVVSVPCLRVPEQVVDGGVELVDAVDPAFVGVEGHVARAGLVAGLPEGLGGRGEDGGAGIDGIDPNAVGAQVVDEEV